MSILASFGPWQTHLLRVMTKISICSNDFSQRPCDNFSQGSMHIIQDIHISRHYIVVEEAIKYSRYMVQLILIGTIDIIGYTWTYRCQGYINHSVRSPEDINQWYMIISYKESDIHTRVDCDIQRSCNWKISRVNHRLESIKPAKYTVELIHSVCSHTHQGSSQSEAYFPH